MAKMTHTNRANAVREATDHLSAAVFAANKSLIEYGPSDARTLVLWEAVEKLGATVHRQSRLLAGKSRGG